MWVCGLVIVSQLHRTLEKKHILGSTKMGVYEPKVFGDHHMKSENEDNEIGGRAKK